MALLRPTVWTQQPQSPVEIDWSNPITQGLVNAANINGGSPAYNLVLGKPAPTGGTLTPSAFAMGYGKKFASAAIQFPRSVYTGAETMLSVCRPTTVDANPRAIMHRRNTTTIGVAQAGATMWLLAYDNAIGLQLIAWQSSGATCVAINSGSANVASNETLVAVGVVPGNGLTAALYKNGNLVNSATQSAALMNAVVTTEVGGRHANNTSRYFAGDQSLALHWNRALSDAEIRSISANPWQIFKPIPRRIFAPVSAGGGGGAITSLSATTDAVTNAFSAQSIPPSAASFAATTADVTNAFAARVSPLAAFAATTASPTNSFSASVSPVTSFAATTASPSAIFVANVSPVVSFNATTGAVTANYGAGVGTGCAFSVTTDAPTNAFSASVPVSASFAVTTEAPANAFSAEVVAPSSSASFSVTTASPVGNLSASVSPVAQFAATSADAIFVGFASAIVPTIGRPSSDVSNTGWTPSSGSDLYAMLDEVTPDDLDYISTSTLGAVCKMNLNATQYPGSAAQKLSLRASSSTGNGLSVVIKDGATTIATRSLTLTPAYDLHTITLTAGEIALISTGALTVEMTST